MKHVLDAHHSTHGSKAAAACLLALPYKVLPSVDATLVEAVVPVLAALSGQSATVHQAAKLCPVPPVQGGSDSQPLPSSGLTFDSHVSPFDAALCALTAAISHQWKGAMPKAESSAATVLAALLTCCANLCRTSEYAVKAARRSLIHIPALGIVIDACQKKELRSPVAIAAASLLSTYTGSSARHKLALRDVGEWLTGLFLRQNALAQKVSCLFCWVVSSCPLQLIFALSCYPCCLPFSLRKCWSSCRRTTKTTRMRQRKVGLLL